MPFLQVGWHPCTSKRTKHSVGAFVSKCGRGRFLPWGVKGSADGDAGHPANTQGKGSPDGGFEGEGKKQDKSRASQVTPGRSHRPAVRTAFRAFTGRGKDSGNYLENLAGVRFWGHFREENHELASAFFKTLQPQRFEAGSNAVPGQFLAQKSASRRGCRRIQDLLH